MGIFQRLSTLLRSNVNDMIAQAENPEKVLNQLLLDMRGQLTKAKREVAAAIADERKLKAQADDERRQSGDWEKRAVIAVRQERDDLARQALVRQEEHAGRALSLHETWQRQAVETGKLKNALRQLNDKMEELRRKKNLLVAKHKRAQAQRRIHDTMSGLSDRSAFEAFDRVAGRIEESERRVLAEAEVSEELSGDTLEQEFEQLESGGDADARLLELKRKMGLLPADPSRRLTDGVSKAGSGGASPVHEAELLEEFERLEKDRPGG
ncbi:MAG: PspA/IM30 family protein [Longimicrobiaceae bacterium]